MAKYVAVWIDHKEARAFHIQPDEIDETTVTAPLHNIHHKHPGGTNAALERRIVGIETVDHPTDAQLVAYAKKYFGLHERGR